MKNKGSTLFWGEMAAMIGLAVISIIGAFLGTKDAHRLFTSWPMVAFWIAAALLLAGSVIAQLFSRNFLSRLACLVMHAGTALILIGAMLSSDQGHAVVRKYLGIDRIPHGYLRIFEGRQTSVVADGNDIPVGQLPFSVGLKKFDVDYYPPRPDAWQLFAQYQDTSGSQQVEALDWKIGQPIKLPGTPNKLTVLQYLPHAKAVYPATQANGPASAYETPMPTATADVASYLPAMEFSIADPNDNESRLWLIAHDNPDDNWIGTPRLSLWLLPQQNVRQYRSKVEILRGDTPVCSDDIEVNHPLSFAGYNLNYHSYSQSPNGTYVLLSVRSSLGLLVVYAGFILVVTGAFMFFWGRPIVQFFRRR